MSHAFLPRWVIGMTDYIAWRTIGESVANQAFTCGDSGYLSLNPRLHQTYKMSLLLRMHTAPLSGEKHGYFAL